MTKHKSVLLQKVVDVLNPGDGKVFVDATLGGGGHTLELLKNASKLTVVGFDQDEEAIKNFEKRLIEEGFEKNKKWFTKGENKVALINSNFENLKNNLKEIEINQINGFIADLGFSTDQLEDENRGFSFLQQGELDMRMDKKSGVQAKDLLNGLYKNELERLFKEYGDLTWEAKKVAEGIESYRKNKKIEKVSDLLEIIKKAVNYKSSRHIEARVFQAIRIAVNREIEALRSVLPQSLETLAPQGVVSVISFHSGEDRIVKNMFKEWEDKGIGTSELFYPAEEEIKENPKASSAKLRVFKKI